MEHILLFLPNLLGVDPQLFTLLLGVLVALANLVGRLIPDTAVGSLGVLRKVCKVVGLYVGNRVAPGISNNDAAQAVIGFRGLTQTVIASEKVKEAAKTGEEVGMKTAQYLDTVLHPTIAPGNPYVEGESPEPGSTVPEEFRTDPMRAGAKKSTKKGTR